MTADDALARMREIAAEAGGDVEGDHSDADAVLCSLLRTLGHDDLVDVYESIPKWFA